MNAPPRKSQESIIVSQARLFEKWSAVRLLLVRVLY